MATSRPDSDAKACESTEEATGADAADSIRS